MNNEKLNDEKLNNEKLNNEKLNDEKLNNDKLNNEKLNNEKLNNEKLNNEKKPGVEGSEGTKRPPLHLDFLDGIRGCAAIYVLLFHIYELFLLYHPGKLSRLAQIASLWMGYGHYAVDVFIVLSGFCLMLPVVSGSPPARHLRGGTGQYLLRRARRILPAYYAALVISLPLVFSLKDFQQIFQGRAPMVVGDILSHFVLLHNLHRDWNMGINGAMWSVATEWQIYFLLPLLLLPVWRRWGILAAVIVGFLVGLAPHFLLPSTWNYDWACPWYLGLFALGMLGAVIASSNSGPMRACYLRAPWPLLLVLSAGICMIILLSHHTHSSAETPEISHDNQKWILDAWIGVTTLCLILSCAVQKRTDHFSLTKSRDTKSRDTKSRDPESGDPESGGRFWLLAIFESRLAMFLGGFSYSIYLLHEPLNEKMMVYLNRLTLPADLLWGLVLCVGAPLLLLLCYLFHLVFERRR